MAKRKKEKPTALRIRKPTPPPGFSFKDKKKEARKKACRKKIDFTR